MKFFITNLLLILENHFKTKVDDFQRIEGGYTNFVYKIRMGERFVIYKGYTSDNTNEENILKSIHTPKILFKGEGYRIEEYLENKPIDYMRDMEEIAIAMRQMHTLENVEAISFTTLINDLCKQAGDSLSIIKSVETKTNEIHFINFKEEAIKELKQEDSVIKVLENIKSRIFDLLNFNSYKTGLCHNDLQPNNMLKTPNGIVIIDYEFGAIGNSLFDIANLFCETHLDYSKCIYDLNLGYQKNDEKNFLNFYLKNEDLEEISKKVEELKKVSHFLWILWAIPKIEEKAEGNFDYSKYARERLNELERSGFLENNEFLSISSFLKN